MFAGQPTPTPTPTPAISWTVSGDLNFARESHTATLLSNGQVLVAGGRDSFNSPLNKAELYDPATGSWTTTGDLNFARTLHTATLLTNGQVLVVGGLGGTGILDQAELYDPATGSWTNTGDLAFARGSHTATLPNGQVLVAGGFDRSFSYCLRRG